MGEEVEEQRFVCKFCNKNCSSGKSLGGHMRSHLALIAAAKSKKLKADNKIDFKDDDDLADDDCGLEENPCFMQEEDKGENYSMNLEIYDQDQDSHVLRQNPKKSWKISDSRIKSWTHSNKSGHLCSKCGKSFESIKALFGHMKIHSKIYTVSSTDGLSEFEFYHPKKKRSIIKYKTFSSLQESANYVNEIDEADEEAANSLIMLSKGGLKECDGFNSQPQSSTNANSSASLCAYVSLCDVVDKLDSCPPLISMYSSSALEHISSEIFLTVVDKKPDNQARSISVKYASRFFRLAELWVDIRGLITMDQSKTVFCSDSSFGKLTFISLSSICASVQCFPNYCV